MHELRVDTYLSDRTANILRYHGFDLSEVNEALKGLVNTNAWRDIEGFGLKRRGELDQALMSVRMHTSESIASSIQLLEAHGYTVTPPHN